MTESEFAEAVYDKLGFDENSDDLELLSLAARFEQLRITWVSGEPYEANAELGSLVNKYYAKSTNRHGIEKAFARLADFCLNKSRAAGQRRTGNNDIAQQYEAAAQREYNQLPQIWKW